LALGIEARASDLKQVHYHLSHGPGPTATFSFISENLLFVKLKVALVQFVTASKESSHSRDFLQGAQVEGERGPQREAKLGRSCKLRHLHGTGWLEKKVRVMHTCHLLAGGFPPLTTHLPTGLLPHGRWAQ
jgi:hypothetical protein